MKYLLIFWSVVVLACQPNNLQESKKELINTFEEMGKAITDGDLESFVLFYSDSPAHFPPGAPMNNSREKIKSFLVDKLDLYVIDGEPTITFSDDASMAFVYVNYHIDEDPQRGIDYVEGRAVVVWRRIDGNWKCVLDIWNSPDPKYEHL